jgi:hypothetical protein
MGKSGAGKISVVRIILGVLGVAAAGQAWRMWGPSAEIAAKVAAGNAWDGAEPELRATLLEGVKLSLAEVNLAPRVHEEFATCLTKGAISFLNKTDCRYEYNTATEDEANHAAAQEACVKAAGYEANMGRVQIECAREHLPKGWELWRTAIQRELEGVIAKDAHVDDREALAACQTTALITLLNQLKCPHVSAEATSLADIRPSYAACITTPEAEQKRQVAFIDCNVQHTTWEAGRAELTVGARGTVDTILADMAISDDAKVNITSCIVDQAITLLNKTGCRYAFNKVTTSEAEHGRQQDECLGKSTYVADLEKVRAGCLVKHVPNDWEILRPAQMKGIRSTFAKLVDADKLDKVTLCIVDAVIGLYKSEQCAVVNSAATSTENFLVGDTACITSKNLGPRLKTILAQCSGRPLEAGAE